MVLKRGAKGCIVYDGAIPDDLEAGIVGQGFPIEIYNVLGAGDAFMSGFLRGWLKGESLATSATWANACGAFAVSRLLCAPEYPSWTELDHFLTHGSKFKALRKDEELNHIHWATTRRKQWPRLTAFAIDHRKQIEDIAGDKADRIPAFKVLAVKAAAEVAGGARRLRHAARRQMGPRRAVRGAQEFLDRAGRWNCRARRPLQFEFSQDVGSRLGEWPVDHCLKVLCFYHPDDPRGAEGRRRSRRCASRYDAARKVGPRYPDRGDCRARPGRWIDADDRAGAGRALRCRAASPTGGSSKRRPTRRRGVRSMR